jgi:hypothetical protein
LQRDTVRCGGHIKTSIGTGAPSQEQANTKQVFDSSEARLADRRCPPYDSIQIKEGYRWVEGAATKLRPRQDLINRRAAKKLVERQAPETPFRPITPFFRRVRASCET